MDALKEHDKDKGSTKADAVDEVAVALKYVDSFINLKEKEISIYGKIAQETPYANIKHNIGFVIEKETECLSDARSLKSLLRDGGIEKTEPVDRNIDLQVYDHMENPGINNVDKDSIKDILRVAINGDKEMVDRLSIISEENRGTLIGTAAEHMINNTIKAKNAVTDLLFSLERGDW
ncbi:MAG: hypothetical protein M1544_02160 [Candidatus Marsarchaeota archaeon]|nr:hypothetical protein [Candidatus Marsarchaeota archaeon]MCL5102135.1 hypothetical protein [Candidatus Marsarchaeota archaeon]